MWTLGFVNRWCLLRGYFRVEQLDLPRADRERLKMAVNADTAAFIAPNHPEFGLDWIIDKELSTIAAPRVASWAAHDIVRSAPKFWSRNNLVANDGGDAAAEYSMRWALEGHGVLMHPEGMVHWTANTVHPLFSGLAELATEAARRAMAEESGRRVFIVPIVWKLRYTEDISDALCTDMARIERELSLASAEGLTAAERFHSLQENLLARQMTQFGFDASSVCALDFFARQEVFRGWLVSDLQSRHAVEPGDSVERTIHRIRRAIEAKQRAAKSAPDAHLGADANKAREADRLGGFSRETYATMTLSQEQIAESLKRIRATLMRRGIRNMFQNYLPPAYGRRVAHVRVPEPIVVNGMRASTDSEERERYVGQILEQARARMQLKLDAINREIEGMVGALGHVNPFRWGR
jgi:hypothetical protein